MKTPWGTSDYKHVYNRDIVFYGTPSHGGFRVSSKLNAVIPENVRQSNGWYEEDVAWCVVVKVFPMAFLYSPNECERTLARETIEKISLKKDPFDD